MRGHVVAARDAQRVAEGLQRDLGRRLEGGVGARAPVDEGVHVPAAHEALAAGLGQRARLAKRGPVAVRLAKKVQRHGLEAPLAVGNAYEADAFGNLFDSADAKEGMRAFLEKRNAQFENR